MGSPEALPLTVLVPEAPTAVEVYDASAALRMAVVERGGVPLLDGGWDVPGVYLLLDPPDEDGSWGCYVGKAPAGLRSRVGTHVRGKEHWRRALLIRRDTTHGFHSAQVGWLEGRLYDLLDSAEDTRLNNGNRPSDETMPSYDRAMLEACVVPVARLLRLIGYDPATADDSVAAATATRPRARTSRFHGISVADLIEAGFIAPDATLVSTRADWPAAATVRGDGRIALNGVVYATPSSAAAAGRPGGYNGWEFWAVETPTGKVTLATLRARLLERRRT